MESNSINSDGNISYQPLHNQEDEEDATEISFMDPPNRFTNRNSWYWYSFGITNYIDAAIQARKSNGTANFKQEALKKQCWRKIKKFIAGFLIIFVLFSTVVWICLQLIGSARLTEISNHILNSFGHAEPNYTYTPATAVDDSTENWVKYVHDFSSTDAIGSKTIFTSPNSTLSCLPSHNGQIPSLLINSSLSQNWSLFQIDEDSCSDHLLTEKLELTGYFTRQDLRHIFTEIPFIISLKLSSVELVTQQNEVLAIADETEKITLHILTTLTITNYQTDVHNSNILDWIDEIFELPFLSEILIWKSHLTVTSLNSLLEKSLHLKSLFLIGNTISCNTGRDNMVFNCPPVNSKFPSLVELTLINGESKLNNYWGSFINSMLSHVEHENKLNILETNVPVDLNVIGRVIETELTSDNNQDQVYEIRLRLPAGLNAFSKKNFMKKYINFFENNNGHAKCNENSKSVGKINLSSEWVNLCRDSDRNTIFYGFGKGTYVHDNQLTVFVRRAATGNIKCNDDVNNKEGFFCKSRMK